MVYLEAGLHGFTNIEVARKVNCHIVKVITLALSITR